MLLRMVIIQLLGEFSGNILLISFNLGPVNYNFMKLEMYVVIVIPGSECGCVNSEEIIYEIK